MAYNTTDLKQALQKGKKRLSTLHPKLNDFEISQLLTLEFYKRTKQPLLHYSQAIHLAAKNWNVACANGSAHVKRTTDIRHVTCALCLIKN